MHNLRKIHFVAIILLFVAISLYSQNKIKAISQIAEENGKAVVLIATAQKDEGTIGLGSGFIVSPTGVIITNYHVIQGAYPAVIKLINGDIYDDISIIDTDERRDIAIIKIKGWELPTVILGNSENVKAGEQVVVIGNPEGLENTVTDGLISAIRDFDKGYKMHQISAPISSGSSGSPVFNILGEVVGIATSSLVEGQNLNFSVPINYARGMISEETKMSLEEFSRQSKISRFPPPSPSGAVYIPKEVRGIMINGLDSKQGRSDIRFNIFRHLHFPAQQNMHNVFLFKVLANETLGSHVFLQFFRMKDGKPIELVKEIYIPTQIQKTTTYTGERFYSFGYPLPSGEYLLAMALASNSLEKIGTQYFEFFLPNYSLSMLDTTPIFFAKRLERMSSAEMKAEVHMNYFTYAVLKIVPNVDNVFSQGDDLDVFYFVIGAKPNNQKQYDINVTYEVYRGTEKMIDFALTKYSNPTVSQPLPLIRTLSNGRKQRLGKGEYTLVIKIQDNISRSFTNKQIDFSIR